MNVREGLVRAQTSDGVFHPVAHPPVANDEREREHENADASARAAFHSTRMATEGEEARAGGSLAQGINQSNKLLLRAELTRRNSETSKEENALTRSQ